MTQSLLINLGTPGGAAENDYVLIEQQEWAKDVGRTSSNQGVLAIGSMIFGGDLPLPNCGGFAGFDTPVYVYPSRRSLTFLFDVSHGDIQPGEPKMLLREEVVKCSLRESVELDYPVQSMRSRQWIGKCYDESNNVVARPAVSQIGRTLYFGEKVYGSIRVKYSVYRITYNVRIEEREDSIENNFECVAFAVWTGGVAYEEIKAPSGYDETYGNCGNGIYGNGIDTGSGSAEICTPESGSGSYPKAVRANRYTKIDYCSQQTMSDKITEIVDKDSDEGEGCSDGSITTN